MKAWCVLDQVVWRQWTPFWSSSFRTCIEKRRRTRAPISTASSTARRWRCSRRRCTWLRWSRPSSRRRSPGSLEGNGPCSAVASLFLLALPSTGLLRMSPCWSSAASFSGSVSALQIRWNFSHSFFFFFPFLWIYLWSFVDLVFYFGEIDGININNDNNMFVRWWVGSEIYLLVRRPFTFVTGKMFDICTLFNVDLRSSLVTSKITSKKN